MKKFLKCLVVAIMAIAMAAMFTGCDKSGSLQRAFEKEGYTVTVVNGADSAILKEWLSEEKLEAIEGYSVIICTKGLLDSATIYKCPSKNDIKETLGEEAYEAAVEADLINGNCYLFLGSSAAKLIFKNA